jgi:hypothetical protein
LDVAGATSDDRAANRSRVRHIGHTPANVHGNKEKVPPFRLDGDGFGAVIVIAPRVLRQSDIFRMRFNLT